MVNALVGLSKAIVAIEKGLVGGLSALMFVLVVIGMFARYLGHAIYWIDEAAVFAMVAMSFFGASLVTRLKQEFAITLLIEYLPARLAWIARLLIAAIGLIFAAILILLSWWMWDPITLAKMSFDVERFSRATFNFIYTETTTTLGLPKFLFLLVLPIYSVFLIIHTAVNVIEAAWAPVGPPEAEQLATVG